MPNALYSEGGSSILEHIHSALTPIQNILCSHHPTILIFLHSKTKVGAKRWSELNTSHTLYVVCDGMAMVPPQLENGRF